MCISICVSQNKNIQLYKVMTIWLFLKRKKKEGQEQKGFYTENRIFYKWMKINVKDSILDKKTEMLRN